MTKLLSDKVIRGIYDCYILGKLVNEETDLDYIPTRLGTEQKAITYHKSMPSKVIIYLQALSPEPKPIEEILQKKRKDCYMSTDDKNNRFLQSIKYFEVEPEQKIEFLRKHLEGKLILFRPKLNPRNPNEPYYEEFPYHYNFEFAFINPEIEDEIADAYIPVPSVRKDLSAKRFEKILEEGKPFTLPEYSNLMEIPDFIVCDGYIYYIPFREILKPNEMNPHTYYCKNPKAVKKLPLEEDWGGHIKCLYKSDLSFITAEKATQLRHDFDRLGQPILEEPKSTSKKEINSRKEEKTAAPPSITEYDFIYKRLKELAKQEGLVYQEEDLINFHISLKTSMINIIGGMSGTGKTRLALLYAKALGLVQEETLLIMPISPAYTESSDILGYLNQQIGAYIEAETGLVTFLKKAEQHPNQMFMVLMEEINLGQVEHYFSPFISLLELPVEQRKLKLFSENAICHQKELRDGILIRDNVIFIGTANFDETTRDLSNRLLDRANVIYLEKSRFREASQEEKSSKPIDNSPISREIYRTQWTKQPSGLNTLKERELDLLDLIHEEMSNFDSQTGVSFRIAMAIAHYLDNIPSDKDELLMLKRERAFDSQIEQRILTKIRGHKEQIQDLVGIFDRESYKYIPGALARLLEDYNDVCEDISRNFLEQKAKELMRNGYTV